MNTLAAIIPVADPSSRMGRFKPLLELNGFPLIRLTVQSALDGGAQTVSVITGRNAPKVEEALLEQVVDETAVKGLRALPRPEQDSVIFVNNANFATSDTLESVKLGLTTLLARHHSSTQPSPQAVFIMPGDMPAISPQTFTALQEQWAVSDSPVLVPTYQGKQGHPVLMSSVCFDALLNYEGEGNVKQALSSFAWEEVEIDDKGILLEADDQEAFFALEPYVQRIRGVSDGIIQELLAIHQTPPNVRAHTMAVAQVALRMANQLNKQGAGLDSELCYSGGRLHDLNRLESNHSKVAADHLHALGYDALASVVGAHDKELLISPRMFSEANLVFVADKLVKETALIKIERRYEGALKRFPPHTESGKIILNDSRSSITLLKRYIEITGDTALAEGTERSVRRSYAKT